MPEENAEQPGRGRRDTTECRIPEKKPPLVMLLDPLAAFSRWHGTQRDGREREPLAVGGLVPHNVPRYVGTLACRLHSAHHGRHSALQVAPAMTEALSLYEA